MSHEMHCMEGLPDSLLGAALAVAVLLSLASTVFAGRWTGAPSAWRFSLTSLRPVRWLVARRWFQTAVQVPLVVALFVILYAGFFGTPVSERNAATIMTWTFWWTLLILDIVLLGRTWCLVCPWDALASWTRRLAFWRRSDEPLALDLRWPRWLSNVYPATVLFIGLTWLELGFGVTMSPRATAGLGLLMVMLAVGSALFFERRSFCKHACLVGRICGLYSMLAPIELRRKDADTCRSCADKDCYTGNARGYPCPTGQYLGAMSSNTYCTLCTECVKTCPHDNVTIDVRPWGADVASLRRPRRDEAALALVLLSMTSFHGLTMTPAWGDFVGALRRTSGTSHLTAFTLGMALVLGLPGLCFFAASALSARWSRRRLALAGERASAARVAAASAYAIIPIALMYHLAHNAGHFLNEAYKILPVLLDPLGARPVPAALAGLDAPLVGQPVVWGLAVGLVLLGHLWSTRALDRAFALIPGGRPRARWPVAAFMLLATIVNLVLLAQPMEMRSGM